MDAQNWLRKNTRKDMIMWPGQSTGICQENAGSTEVINGTVMSLRENKKYKLLWDFSIRTDHNIEAGRPDLVLIDKLSKKHCQIIDVAISVE